MKIGFFRQFPMLAETAIYASARERHNSEQPLSLRIRITLKGDEQVIDIYGQWPEHFTNPPEDKALLFTVGIPEYVIIAEEQEV